MNLDTIWCGDLESDDLLEKVTKIHVFSFGQKRDSEWKVSSTNDYEAMKRFFTNPDHVIAIHNGIRFDKAVLEKVLGIKVKATIIDTLPIAWYVDFNREKFGLEQYGVEFGVEKPPVSDWQNLTYTDYKHRCEEDVKITIALWNKLLTKLRTIYDTDEDIVRIIKYLGFIMECAYHQERQQVQVDIEKTKANLAYFESLKEAKVAQLKQAMPKVPIVTVKRKPKEMYKKNGTLSVAGQKWMELNTDKEEVEVITGYTEANPNSTVQKKQWLFGLGWEPVTFKYDRNKETNEVRKIEQILTDEKMLCPSVLKLKEKEPAIELLDSLSILTHRIGLLKGFLENQKDGFIAQGLLRLAVTLRWQHLKLVNLPKVSGKNDIRDGKWIRECLIAGEGKKLVQADLSGIESRTSDHYTFPLDPDLIKETQAPDFDPHLKIAVVSNLMTQQESDWFKWKKNGGEMPDSLSSFKVDDEKALMDRLKSVRHKAKTCNYASLYNVGATTLSRNLSISKTEAEKLISAYWRVHWSVKEVTKTFHVKYLDDGEMWVLNPISKFRYHLRHEKDLFSVVNQGSAVYCFNIWLLNVTRMGYWPISQSHDDLVLRVDDRDAEKAKAAIIKAMELTNKQLKLNVKLDCEVQVGDSLDQTH